MPSHCRRRGSGGEAGGDAELRPASLTARGGACTTWARAGVLRLDAEKRPCGCGLGRS
jgi:hypothetical protein